MRGTSGPQLADAQNTQIRTASVFDRQETEVPTERRFPHVAATYGGHAARLQVQFAGAVGGPRVLIVSAGKCVAAYRRSVLR